MQLIKNFIAWTYNDYTLVDVFQGIWNVSVSSDFFGDYKETKYCRFEILYSKIANKYIMRSFGYRPHDHQMYPIALEEFNRLKKQHENNKNV